jgi:endonuclease/exonuclease/phosphatase family metal-dependent hydrolase
MTFNLRFPCLEDIGNLWSERREMVFEVIRLYRPDILGMQEVYRSQLIELLEALPEYAAVGKERYGDTDEEHNPIFFRSSRFFVEGAGTDWFSATPGVPGTRTICPDDHPRVVTWAQLSDSRSASRLQFLNTHFPLTRDDAVKIECAKVVAKRVAKAEARTARVLVGDFNALPDGGLHAFLTAAQKNGCMGLEDARQVAYGNSGPEGTVHHFEGLTHPRERRIDWILISNGVVAEKVETITFSRMGRYPSDHYPVCADLVVPNGME